MFGKEEMLCWDRQGGQGASNHSQGKGREKYSNRYAGRRRGIKLSVSRASLDQTGLELGPRAFWVQLEVGA